MEKRARIICFLAAAVMALSITAACTAEKKRVISPNKMAVIVSELYMADQYVDFNAAYIASMDSVKLYDGVMARHGYTFEEYVSSVEYYLQKGDELQRIYSHAKRILNDKKKAITLKMSKSVTEYKQWWATDSIAKRDINDLWKEPYLRNINNLIFPEGKYLWIFTDTTEFDTPIHPIWWENIFNAPARADKSYPVLLRDYMLYKERTDTTASHTPRYINTNLEKLKRVPAENRDGAMKKIHPREKELIVSDKTLD